MILPLNNLSSIIISFSSMLMIRSAFYESRETSSIMSREAWRILLKEISLKKLMYQGQEQEV